MVKKYKNAPLSDTKNTVLFRSIILFYILLALIDRWLRVLWITLCRHIGKK